MAIENNHNQNSPLSIGDRNRAVHISPPLPGDQTILLNPTFRRLNEEMIRRIVKEEIQVREELREMSHHNLFPRQLPDANIQARYQLLFNSKVKNPIFTTDPVRDDNGCPIEVAICDTYNQSTISPDNFLSSAKVKLTVLNAEFWENRINWSRSEFVQNVLRERESKGPILIGRSLIIQLENGVGTFENIVFNDNSSWTKSGFRLGVMVEGDGEEGYLNGERVREGVSQPFRVKDCRVKASQKPDMLKLKHSVQCIKKIGKSRASFLKKKNINTVEDFLHLYYDNESELRNILCIKSESGKEWESMVEHVKQCADEFHAKYNASNNSSHPLQPMAKNNLSVCTKVGCWGSSKPNLSEKDDIIEAGMPICRSMDLSNGGISTAYDNLMEFENPFFHGIGDSVQLTNVGGFSQSEQQFDTFYLDTIMDGIIGNPDIRIGKKEGVSQEER